MRDWKAYVRERLGEMRVAPAREFEIISELALHLEQAYDEALASGASAEQAILKVEANWTVLARDIERVESAPIPESRPGLLTGTLDDIRQALRSCRKNPAFAAIVIGTLAFGIGGNTTIFAFADALALRGLPYPDASRLVAIETRSDKQPDVEPWTSSPDYFDFERRTNSFSKLAAISPIFNDVLTVRDGAERLDTLYATASLFPMLGVQPALGRTFTPAEDEASHRANVAVLSDAFWRSHFGSRTDALGEKLLLNGQPFTVIGVLPRDFQYLGEPVEGKAVDIQVWMPLASNPLFTETRAVRFLKVIGRLKPGVSAAQAGAEVAALGRTLAEGFPETNRGYSDGVVPLEQKITGRLRPTMWLLLATVGFVLLMACANVANLFLARAVARQKEFAVRSALGAPRYRLLRQVVVEGLVFAFLGGLAGIAVARLGLEGLLSLAPASLVQSYPIHLDFRALAATFAAVILCSAISAFPVARSLLSGNLQPSLGESGRSVTAGNRRAQSTLVVIEVAVALVLLVGSGLLIRSFRKLLDIQPGFDSRNVVTISIQAPPGTRTPEQRTALYQLIRQKIESISGVQGVGAVSRLPMMGSNLGTILFIEGKSRSGEPGPDVEYRVATPSYFRAMGIPLREGRFFDDHDKADVVLVNEAAARQFWPGESAVGKRVKVGPNPNTQSWITILGVVGNVRHFGLDLDARPELYRPYVANPLFAPILVVRTEQNPEAIARSLAATIRSVDAGIPAYNLFLMQTLVDRSTAQRRFVMWLLTGFAVTALLLAGVGVYGTVSQSVARRTRELGVRMALGSSQMEALILVFRSGMKLVGMGLIAGVIAGAALTQLMRRLLFEIQPLDPWSFVTGAIVLALFAGFACLIPARRAMRVDPLVALRDE